MHNPCHQVTEKGERAPLKYVLLQPMENGRRKSGIKKNRIRICVKLPFFKEIAPAVHITNPNWWCYGTTLIVRAIKKIKQTGKQKIIFSIKQKKTKE